MMPRYYIFWFPNIYLEEPKAIRNVFLCNLSDIICEPFFVYLHLDKNNNIVISFNVDKQRVLLTLERVGSNKKGMMAYKCEIEEIAGDETIWTMFYNFPYILTHIINEFYYSNNFFKHSEMDAISLPYLVCGEWLKKIEEDHYAKALDHYLNHFYTSIKLRSEEIRKIFEIFIGRNNIYSKISTSRIRRDYVEMLERRIFDFLDVELYLNDLLACKALASKTTEDILPFNIKNSIRSVQLIQSRLTNEITTARYRVANRTATISLFLGQISILLGLISILHSYDNVFLHSELYSFLHHFFH